MQPFCPTNKLEESQRSVTESTDSDGSSNISGQPGHSGHVIDPQDSIEIRLTIKGNYDANLSEHVSKMDRNEFGAGHDVLRSPNREYRTTKSACPVISIETCSQMEMQCSSDSEDKSEKDMSREYQSNNLLSIFGGFRRNKSPLKMRQKNTSSKIKDSKEGGGSLIVTSGARRSKSFSDVAARDKKNGKRAAKMMKQDASLENNKQKSFLSVIRCLKRSKSSSEVNNEGAESRRRSEDDKSADEAGSDDSTVRMFHHSARDNSSTSSCISSSSSADESDAGGSTRLSTVEGEFSAEGTGIEIIC